jgi:hypothetical protein
MLQIIEADCLDEVQPSSDRWLNLLIMGYINLIKSFSRHDNGATQIYDRGRSGVGRIPWREMS